MRMKHLCSAKFSSRRKASLYSRNLLRRSIRTLISMWALQRLTISATCNHKPCLYSDRNSFSRSMSLGKHKVVILMDIISLNKSFSRISNTNKITWNTDFPCRTSSLISYLHKSRRQQQTTWWLMNVKQEILPLRVPVLQIGRFTWWLTPIHPL